ncbi:MAG: hypothetical protein WCJ60_04410 [bacterium]
MTNTAVVGEILVQVGAFMAFLLPVIGLLAGLQFIFSWLMEIIFGLGRRTFKV